MGDICQGRWMCFANAPKQIDDDNMWEKYDIFWETGVSVFLTE